MSEAAEPCPLCWGQQIVSKVLPNGTVAVVDCPLCCGAGNLPVPDDARVGKPPAIP